MAARISSNRNENAWILHDVMNALEGKNETAHTTLRNALGFGCLPRFLVDLKQPLGSATWSD